MATTDAQHDVIVIGAGIAGLVAANRAAQLGKRVVVLEKGTDERYLCNSRYTYGTFTPTSAPMRTSSSRGSTPPPAASPARIWRAPSPGMAAG